MHNFSWLHHLAFETMIWSTQCKWNMFDVCMIWPYTIIDKCIYHKDEICYSSLLVYVFALNYWKSLFNLMNDENDMLLGTYGYDYKKFIKFKISNIFIITVFFLCIKSCMIIFWIMYILLYNFMVLSVLKGQDILATSDSSFLNCNRAAVQGCTKRIFNSVTFTDVNAHHT